MHDENACRNAALRYLCKNSLYFGVPRRSLFTSSIVFHFQLIKIKVEAINVPSFDVYLHLIAGDGLIQEKELAHVMRACMDENGMKFDEGEVDELTRYQFRQHVYKKLLC